MDITGRVGTRISRPFPTPGLTHGQLDLIFYNSEILPIEMQCDNHGSTLAGYTGALVDKK